MTQKELIEQAIGELKTAEKACADSYSKVRTEGLSSFFRDNIALPVSTAHGNIKYARELLEQLAPQQAEPPTGELIGTRVDVDVDRDWSKVERLPTKEEFKEMLNWPCVFCDDCEKQYNKACDRLDAQRQEIEDSKTRYDDLYIEFIERGLEIEKLRKLNTHFALGIEQLTTFNRSLTAENAKLILSYDQLTDWSQKRIEKLEKAIQRCLTEWGEEPGLEREWLEQALKENKPE